ncbi:MAG: YceD family protein [Clostridiales bacterium]|nr:YceD family protein [Clostridiales bacterium]
MECNIALALKRAGESFPFSWEGRLAPEEFGGERLVFPETVRIAGELCFDGDALTVTGTCKVPVRRNCARCNAAATQTVALSFSERFLRETTEDEAYTCNGDTLSLERMFWDGFWLHLPMTALCRADCESACSEETEKENPFAILRTLHPESAGQE